MKWISGLLIAVFMIFAAEAWGQECSVSTVPVQFGQYISNDPSPVDSIGSIIVSCPSGTAFTVKLGPGENSAGNFYPRKLQSSMSGDALNYNLHRDASHTEIWGDGTNNTFVHSGVGFGGNEIINVYGRISGGMNVGEGFYRDSITVIVDW